MVLDETLTGLKGVTQGHEKFRSMLIQTDVMTTTLVLRGTVLLDLEKCKDVGGSFKASCSPSEKEVGPGCSADHFCCCAPLDGKDGRSLLHVSFLLLNSPASSRSSLLILPHIPT